MAVDEAILESSIGDEELPTLRIYSWEPPCLSLGYAQPISDVDREELQKQGWNLVRRPTGGRAILHTDELTYSVIGSQQDPRLAGGVLESYKNLSRALVAALHKLGIPAESQSKPKPPTDIHTSKTRQSRENQNPVCFEVPSNYEITVGEKKLIGSAQARRKGSVLQHGSLPLSGDLTRITRVLQFPNENSRFKAASRLYSRATTVTSILGSELSWDTVSQALISAFEETLHIDLLSGDLTNSEIVRVDELLDTKYAHPDWIERV